MNKPLANDVVGLRSERAIDVAVGATPVAVLASGSRGETIDAVSVGNIIGLATMSAESYRWPPVDTGPFS